MKPPGSPPSKLQQKANRLVDEGRVALAGETATVTGDHGTYELRRHGGKWQCPCESHLRKCSHVLAVETVDGRDRTWREIIAKIKRKQVTPRAAKVEKETTMGAPFNIKQAVKSQKKARVMFSGPSGSGKTYTALQIAKGLVGDGRKVVIDTERGSASLYANLVPFDVLDMDTFAPQKLMEAVHFCEQQGYECIIVDSMSHFWEGEDGLLQQVDEISARMRGNSFAAFKEATPIQRAMIDTFLRSPAHVILTARTKTEWVVEKDERTGKSAPRKIGISPIQRAGIEYEWDLSGFLDDEHNFVVEKTRIPVLDRKVLKCPGEELGKLILDDLMNGAPAVEAAPAPTEPTAPTPAPAPAEAPGESDSPFDNPEPRSEPYVMPEAWQAGIRKQLAKLGYPEELIVEALNTPRCRVDAEQLIEKLKKGKIAAYVPPAETAPATETPTGSGGSPQAGADDAGKGSPQPADTDAPAAPTATDAAEQPLYNTDGTPANDAAAALDFQNDETGAVATPLTEEPAAAAGDGASPQKLLTDAHEHVLNGAVEEELQDAITSTPLLRTKIAAECGVPLDEQASLLETLGLAAKGWNDLDDGDRLAVWWMAERVAAQYAP